MQLIPSIYWDRALWLSDRPAEALQALSTTRLTAERLARRRGYRIAHKPCSLVQPQLNGAGELESVDVPLGLWQVAAQRLKALGLPECARIPASILQFPEPEVVDALSNFVFANLQGLIRLGPTTSVEGAISRVVTAFPGVRIAILTHTSSKAARLAHWIRNCDPGCEVEDRGHTALCQARIVVSTPDWILGDRVELEHRQLVLVDNAVQALGRIPRGQLGFARHARLFGFLPAHQHVAPLDRAELVSLFGLSQIVVRDSLFLTRPVGVCWVPFRGEPRALKDPDLVHIKRANLWRHRDRNALIAKLARRLARQRLRSRRCRVLVVVENVDHGLKLAQLLNWPLLVGRGRIPESPSAAVLEFWTWPDPEAEPLPKTPMWAVATASSLPCVRRNFFDCVVRADGGQQSEQLMEFLTAGACDQADLVLLFDMADRHHPLLRRWSRRRRQDYFSEGFQEHRLNKSQFLARQFLASLGLPK